jgi:hypothetical protein
MSETGKRVGTVDEAKADAGQQRGKRDDVMPPSAP